MNTLSNSTEIINAAFGGSQAKQWEVSENRSAQAITGLRILLLAIGSLFFLFIVALLTRSQFSDYESLSAAWQPFAQPWLLWINTGLLVIAGASLHWARTSVRNQQHNKTIEGLLLAGLFTSAFLIGQWMVWQQLITRGYFMASNPANSFFYLLTGLHALHILVGMVALVLATAKIHRGISQQKAVVKVTLCAIYWNFLLVVWLILFALLASPPSAFEAFAKLCGLR